METEPTESIDIVINTVKNIPKNEYISGERLQSLADIYLGDYNPGTRLQREKYTSIDSITDEFNNPRIVFCYGHLLPQFIHNIKYFKNPFILITHNSAANINERYSDIANHPLLISWYAQNPGINHPKLKLLPVGIANKMWRHGNLDILSEIANLAIPKTKDVYFNFSVGTNRVHRSQCKSQIESKGLLFLPQLPFKEYLTELAKHKFAICPFGSGLDCHRIWECYYLGVIPILVKHQFTTHLANILPCIILSSWADFNYDECMRQYPALCARLVENKKYMLLSYYKSEILC